MTSDLLLALLPDHRALLEAMARRYGVSAEQVAEALLTWVLKRLAELQPVAPDEIERFIGAYCRPPAAEACLGEADLETEGGPHAGEEPIPH